MTNKTKNPLSTFESDLKKMQSILEEIESKDLTLEEIIKKYQEGITLSKRCEEALKEAEQKVKLISDKSKK
ncbi:MAG: exodeoxyribonuclease VII small subunit [Gammaproteobacteria bacterium]|nr:exodeoxyribonuclease VII small subunit [Gammaproteobacteria bacterium]|tara:strand:- start:207635 stop:207847 length:213 start_codon:yes stop_codon:yes gene_type:complete